MAFVYILKSKKNGRYYIGSTINFNERFKRHENGLVKSTKYLRPFSVELVQEYPTVRQAKNIEYRLKQLKRKDYIEKIIQDKYIKIQ